MNTNEFLNNRISELEKELNGLKRALYAYENNVDSTNMVEKPKKVDNIKSSYNGTWIENILTVIKNKDRFLHNAEIAEELFETYSDKDKKTVRRRISAVLSNALSKGEIESLTNYRFTKSIKDTVWGKKEWINDKGEIKKEYMFTNKENNNQSRLIEF